MTFRQDFRFRGIMIAALILGAGLVAVSVTMTGGTKGPAAIEFKWNAGAVFERDMAAHIGRANADLSMTLMQIRKNPDSVTLESVTALFGKTYLKNPALTMGGDKVVSGWEQVLPALKALVSRSEYVTVGTVMVDLEYVPYDREKAPKPETDLDVRAAIRTRLAVYPSNDPDIIGALGHRRVCVIDP